VAESIKAAGGVVVQGKRILFIKKNGRWDLPKGKLKKGANRKKTAIREVCEETGLKKKDLKILQVLIPTYHHMKLKGSINVKETFWFLVQYTGSPKVKLIPDRNEGITKCKWFDLDQLMLALKDSRPIIHYLIGFVLNEAVYKKYYKSQ
jgi:8-oxo-dGTP pyrophosphatase MutT (NUDIX family)